MLNLSLFQFYWQYFLQYFFLNRVKIISRELILQSATHKMMITNRKNYLDDKLQMNSPKFKISNASKAGKSSTSKPYVLNNPKVQSSDKQLKKLYSLGTQVTIKQQNQLNFNNNTFGQNENNKKPLQDSYKQTQRQKIKVKKIKSLQNIPTNSVYESLPLYNGKKNDVKSNNFSSKEFLTWCLSKEKSKENHQQTVNKPKFLLNYHSQSIQNHYQSFVNGLQIYNKNYKIFGIIQTHGIFGPRIQNFIKQNLFQQLKKGLQAQTDVQKLIKKVYRSMFNQICQLHQQQMLFSGAATTFCLIQNRYLYSFNIGNNKTILGSRNNFGVWSSQQLSSNHTLLEQNQQNRIMINGGKITKINNSTGSNRLRVFAEKDGKVFGSASTRCFGDLFLAEYGVISIPDVNKIKIQSSHKIVFIGQQKIFSLIDPTQIIQFCSIFYRKQKSAQEASKALSRKIRESAEQQNWSRQQCGFILIFIE